MQRGRGVETSSVHSLFGGGGVGKLGRMVTSKTSNPILCSIITPYWRGTWRHLYNSPLFVYQMDSWLLSTLGGITGITWKLSPVQTLRGAYRDGSLGKGSPAASLTAIEYVLQTSAQGGACLSILHSDQSPCEAHTKADIPLEPRHCYLWTLRTTMTWNGLRPHAMYLDLFDVDLVVVVCWSQLSLPYLSFLLLLPIPQGGINCELPLKSILLSSHSHRNTDGHGCPARDCNSKPPLQLGVAMTGFFSKGR